MRATYIELLDPRPRSIATLSWHFKNEVLSSDILSAQSNARAYPSTTSSWPFRGMLRDCVYDQANTQRYFCFALPAIIGPVLASLLLHGGGGCAPWRWRNTLRHNPGGNVCPTFGARLKLRAIRARATLSAHDALANRTLYKPPPSIGVEANKARGRGCAHVMFLGRLRHPLPRVRLGLRIPYTFIAWCLSLLYRRCFVRLCVFVLVLSLRNKYVFSTYWTRPEIPNNNRIRFDIRSDSSSLRV